MPLEHLAGSCDVSAATLSLLTTHACTDPGALGPWLFNDADRDRTRTALAGNPRTSLADTLTLVRYDSALIRAVARRPGMSSADALTYTDVRDRTGPSAAYAQLILLGAAADLDGTIARHVYTHTTHDLAYGALLAHPATPPDVRAGAAIKFARYDQLTTTDRLLIVAVALTQPAHQDALAAAARHDRVLSSILARVVGPDGQGTPRWYSTQATAVTALSYLARTPAPADWISALTYLPRAERDLVADAAITAHPGNGTLLDRIAATATTPAVVQRALLALARTGEMLPKSLRDITPDHLAHGPAQFAADFAPYAQTNRELFALLSRPDLTPATLDTVTDIGATFLTGRAQSRHHTAVWAAGLATHVRSTPAQRVRGERLVQRDVLRFINPKTGRITAQHTPLSAAAEVLAHAGQLLDTGTPADAGRGLPLDALNGPVLRTLPPIDRLIAAAFAASPEVPANDLAVRTLIGLLPHFDGTLGELLDTAAALAK